MMRCYMTMQTCTAHPEEPERNDHEEHANTITFIPHRMRNMLARVYSAKMDELSSHMQRKEDTLNRELLNMLVCAMRFLILGLRRSCTRNTIQD